MTKTKNILAVHDISCVGRCSLTVALPIISHFGVEARVLPTGLLSTHTGGFTGFTFLDLTDEMRKILAAWKPLNLQFDSIYTGYLGSAEQIDLVKEILTTYPSNFSFDPVMADNGELYPAFDDNFVAKMRELVPLSNLIMPNLTEASFLTEIPYQTEQTEAFLSNLTEKLQKMGAKNIVLTGIEKDNKIGARAISETSEITEYLTEKIGESYHGTGDIFGSVLVAELTKGEKLSTATTKAVDFVRESIRETPTDADLRYGVNFEAALEKDRK